MHTKYRGVVFKKEKKEKLKNLFFKNKNTWLKRNDRDITVFVSIFCLEFIFGHFLRMIFLTLLF